MPPKAPAAAPSPADVAFARLNDVCLALPGTECKLSHGSPSFFVRGKMFLSFVDDHHGDGRLAVWIKSTFEDQRRLVAEDGERFFVPPYVGVKGWLGVRLDHPKADWIELAILAEAGWASNGPKTRGGSGRAAPPAKRAAPIKRPTTDAKVAKAALEKLKAICLALPEAAFDTSAGHATFTVNEKTFAYFFNNHHGDEIIAACVKVPKGENEKLAKKDPKRFTIPQYIGPRGWVGMRLDVAKVDWKDVEKRVGESYRAVAPKRLLATPSTVMGTKARAASRSRASR